MPGTDKDEVRNDILWGGWVSIWDNTESILELKIEVGLGKNIFDVLGAIELATFTFVTFTPMRKNKLLLKTCAGSLFPWAEAQSFEWPARSPGSVAPWPHPLPAAFFSYWAHWPPCMLWLHASHFPPFALAVPLCLEGSLPTPMVLPPSPLSFLCSDILRLEEAYFCPPCFQLYQPQGPFPLFLLHFTYYLPMNCGLSSDWFWLWFVLLLPPPPLPAPPPPSPPPPLPPPPPPLHC